jgi:multisubunit Na+/H+ antiporter MnhC subunit
MYAMIIAIVVAFAVTCIMVTHYIERREELERRLRRSKLRLQELKEKRMKERHKK